MEKPVLVDAYGADIPQKDKAWAIIAPFICVILVATVAVGSYFAGVGHGVAKANRALMTTWTAGTVISGDAGLVVTRAAISYGDKPKTRVLSGPEHIALVQAYQAWHRKLGTMPIPIPKLYDGTALHCGFSAIACTDPSRGEITIANKAESDLRTVLMHEIGHLLGVPHIEDDSLMNSSYQETVGQPTDFAVALAKTAIAKKSATP